MRAIAEAGQVVPVLVIPGEQPQSWVLIDGYRRLEVLRRLEIEEVKAHVLPCKEDEAMLLHMAQGQSRSWEVIEEAGLIRELHDRFNFSLRQIATRIGRHASWVQRRLAIIRDMPPEVLDRVLRGHISTWAASRILMPLARANSEHAMTLLNHLDKEELSTRELQTWWQYYQQSNHKVRDNLVHNPVLFLKSLQIKQEEQEAASLRRGTDGAWFEDLRIIGHMLHRLRRSVPSLFSSSSNSGDQQTMMAALNRTARDFSKLHDEIQKVTSHDQPGNSPNHPDPASEQHLCAPDRPIVENFPQHGAQHFKTTTLGGSPPHGGSSAARC